MWLYFYSMLYFPAWFESIILLIYLIICVIIKFLYFWIRGTLLVWWFPWIDPSILFAFILKIIIFILLIDSLICLFMKSIFLSVSSISSNLSSHLGFVKTEMICLNYRHLTSCYFQFFYTLSTHLLKIHFASLIIKFFSTILYS